MRNLTFETLEVRRVLASVWQNPVRELDIDNDLSVDPLDVLNIVNKINATQGDFRLGPRTNSLDFYFDTDGDGYISPLDALNVINAINGGVRPYYPIIRTPGTSEPAPAGFTSIPALQLPGTKGDTWELLFEIQSQSKQFHELGVFSIDNGAGDIGEVNPTDPNYPFKAFASLRQPLFSHRGAETSRNSAIAEGGEWISVYVLQPSSPFADPHQHLQIVDRTESSFTLKWAERASTFDPLERFEDAVISVTVRPINRNPLLEAKPPTQIRAGSVYKTSIQTFDPDGDQVSYRLLMGPNGMRIDAATGLLSWETRIENIGRHQIQVEVSDGRGGASAQAFDIEVLPSLLNQPPVITSRPNVTLKLDADSIPFASNAISMENWTPLTFPLGEQHPSGWQLVRNNQEAVQVESFLPTMLLSDFEISNHRFEVRTNSNYYFGNGFFGIVFGYQDDRNFYLLDWKQGDDDNHMGMARNGISIKKFSATTPLSEADLWMTDVPSSVGKLLFHQDHSWDRSEYRITLDQTHGKLRVLIEGNDQFIEQIELSVPELTGGRVGLYTNNQAPSAFHHISTKLLGGAGYQYSVHATDQDADNLRFRLVAGPSNMAIDPRTGHLTWQPTYQDRGDHAVAIEVDDGNGGTALQEYVLCVYADIENGAPRIISSPVIDYNTQSIEPYTYQVQAVDPEGNPLRFSLIEAPDGMQIDPSTGLIVLDNVDARNIPGEFYSPPRAFHHGAGGVGTVRVRVDDGLGGFDEQMFELFAYDSLPASISGFVYEDTNRNGILDSTLVLGAAPYLVFVVDNSCSMDDPFAGETIGDLNGDDRYDSRLDAALKGIKLLLERLANSPSQSRAKVSIVGLDVPFDMDPIEEGVQYFTDLFSDKDGNGIRDYEDSFQAMYTFCGGTDYEQALKNALEVLSTSTAPSDPRNVLFMTDGLPERSGPYLDEVETLRLLGVNLQGIGIGRDTVSDYLREIDPVPYEISHTAQLLEFFNGHDISGFDAIEPLLSGWTVYLDKNLNGIRDQDEPFRVTSSDGFYEFEDLTAGRYVVRVEVPSGWGQITPIRSYYAPVLFGGETRQSLNFGNEQVVGTLENRAPLFVTEPFTSIEIGSTYRYDAIAQDPESQPIRYQLSLGPTNASIHPILGTLLWKPSLQDVGIHNFMIRAVDAQGGSTIQTFQVKVSPSNQPPVVTSQAPTVWPMGHLGQYQIRSIDPDGDAIRYSLRNGPEDAILDPVTGRFEWRPDSSYRGIVMSDGPIAYWPFDELSGATMFHDISGNGFHAIANEPLEKSDGALSGITGDSIVVQSGVSIEAPTAKGLPLLNFSVEAWIKTAELNSTGIASLTHPNSGLSVSLLLGSFGVDYLSFYDLSVTFPDELTWGEWHHVVGIFDVDFRSLYIDGSLVGHTENSIRPVDLRGGFDIGLPFYWHGTTMIDEMAIYDYPLRHEQVQSHYLAKSQPSRMVEVEVTDSRGASTVHAFEMLVEESYSNDPPIIIDNLPKAIGAGRPFLHPIVVRNHEGDRLSFRLISGPEGLRISSEGHLQWTPSTTQVGMQTLELEVSDYLGGTSRLSTTLEVITSLLEERFAIDSSPPTSTSLHTELRYQPKLNGSNVHPVVWSLRQAPLGMVIDPQTGLVVWSPSGDQLGVNSVEIVAVSVDSKQTNQMFVIEVVCHAMPPQIDSTPGVRAIAGQSYSYWVNAVSQDPMPIVGRLVHAPLGMTLNSLHQVTWTPRLEQIGIHSVELQFSNGSQTVVQTYSIEVVDPRQLNQPPIIDSEPSFFGVSGSLYRYQMLARDHEGQTLTYSASGSLPTGASLSNDGLLLWTPTDDQSGSHLVSLQVTDANGAFANQTFLIQVDENEAPFFVSTPPTTLVRGSQYQYLAKGIDPEGASIRYRLISGPTRMSMDLGGRIQWTSSPLDVGPIDVTIQISDDRGREEKQSWQIQMLTDTLPPTASISVHVRNRTIVENSELDIGTIFRVRVTGSDNVAVSQRDLRVDGKIVLLDEDGFANLIADAMGSMTLVGTVRDAEGLEAQDSLTIGVVDPAIRNTPVPTDPMLPPNPGLAPTDNGTPIIIITSPEPASTVSGLVSVIGTVDDPEDNLWFYRVYYARADRVDLTTLDMEDPDWVLLKTSTSEVVDDELAVFDSSLVFNAPYTIAVAAYDVNGRGYIQPTMVYVEGNAQIGNFHIEVADLSIPLAGIPIQVSRTYDTHNALDEGDFGFGWSLAISDPRIFEAAAVGAGGVFTPGNDKFVPGKTKVYLTNPSGMRVGFTYQEEPKIGGLFGAIFRPHFVPDPGVYDRLLIDETQVVRGLIGGDFGQGINPEHYTLVTKEGVSYRYHDTNGLETIEDRNGNVLRITATGMRHSSGQSIEFVRDAQGRITAIVDPNGNRIQYSYSASGDLISVTNQTGLETRYSYRTDRPHYLHEAFDSLGRRVLKAKYDERGEFVGIVDALGNLSEQAFDTAAGSGVVRDANGNATTLVYDDRGNVLTETDPFGNVTIREYKDPDNPDLETKIIDRNGMVTERSYDTQGNVLQIVELGHKESPLATPIVTTFTYSSRNEVTSITNASGATTVFAYDNSGNLTKIVNAVGNFSSFTYDDQGRRSSFTDFNGNVTHFEYSAPDCGCSNPRKITYADGTYQQFEYNDFGQVTLDATYEANGTPVERKATFYDAQGRVTREVIGGGSDSKHPATDVRKFYNGHLLAWEIIVTPESLSGTGELLESPATPVAQRKSRITQYEYDARDNLVRQIDAMGGIVDFRYDPQGNRVLLRDPVGNITTWTYDSLNRVAEERDPFYWVDFVGANGGLNDSALLDAVVEENKKPSGASVETNQGAAHVRSFAYDAEGNQKKVIDRNNRVREFEYDFAGRMVEERWYAANNGPLVETISFTYDVLGNMLTASDSSSNYLHTYDSLNRLISVDNNPDGTRDVPRVVLHYVYDAQGNVLSTSDDSGVTVSSEYDSRNRLHIRRWFDMEGASDVDEVSVVFLYNAAGREIEVQRYSDLDGETLVGRTVRTYDLAGRSDLLSHRNALDQALSEYDYDYDFSGLLVHEERVHQDAQFSQSIDYRYDLTGQLIDADFSGQEDEEYRYDANGNRIFSRNGNDPRTYSTGVANQLLWDGVFDYEYDGEGNQVKRVNRETGETRTFEYDQRNRLVRVDDWSVDPKGLIAPEPIRSADLRYDSNDRIILEFHFSDLNGTENYGRVYSEHWQWYESELSAGKIERFLPHEFRDVYLVSSSQGGEWIYTDKLGTVRVTSSFSDTSVDSFEYSAFGILLSDSLRTGAEFGHSGRALIGLDNATYDFQTRFYDAGSGRFLSEDTIGFEGGDANLYRFVFNTPVNLVDPDGTTAMISYSRISSATARAAQILADCVTDIVIGAAFEASIYFILIDGVPYVGKTQREVAQRASEHRRKFQASVVEILQEIKVPRANVRQYEQFAMDTFDRVVGVGRKNSIRSVSLSKYVSPC